ncbi:MAG: hypothetical protein HQM14_18925 [SAR324 cluster bacterium]|nr:hypothetical protein [SAR324 cluster bacterium]
MSDKLYKIYQDFMQQGIFMCFNGPLSQNLMVEIGETVKQKMELAEAGTSRISKVFAIMVEQAQNILHYSEEKIPDRDGAGAEYELRFGIISIGYADDHYFVTCGNRILNSRVDTFREKLTQLQQMDKTELKKAYKEQLKKGPEEGSKGAGLGFIEMARKSSKPIEFNFQTIDEEFSFFSIKILI